MVMSCSHNLASAVLDRHKSVSVTEASTHTTNALSSSLAPFNLATSLALFNPMCVLFSGALCSMSFPQVSPVKEIALTANQ